jgi:glycosyltransferase involved in cell wall biosynthesis
MKLSYLVTCSTETDTLKRLVEKIYNNLGSDELLILQDEANWNPKRKKYLCDITEFKPAPPEIVYLPIFAHPLNANYGEHKDWGASKCSGEFIFQIDGDELPSDYLVGENLHAIIEANNNVELIYVPRINDFRGVKPEHAIPWGWKLTESPTYKRPIVNWPDYQGRIFKNEPLRIKWDRRLHEKLIGHNSYAWLPAEEDYALYHDKTIEKQIETNIRYNKLFSEEENKGHHVT